jgi:xylono-1,5-lactonase
MNRFHVRCEFQARAFLGEGPTWSARERAVWFVDIKGRRISRFDTHAVRLRSWSAPAQIGFLLPIADGGFIAGLQTGLHRFDPTHGEFVKLVDVEPRIPTNRLNDGFIDPQGRLWFGSMDDNERDETGALYLYAHNTLAKMDDGYCITNSPTLSPDGRTLYHTDTLRKIIYAFDLSDEGALSNKRIFTTIEKGMGYPDGSVTDAEGCVWTGLYGGWKLVRHSPRGELIGDIEFPCANVTKACFGGDDLRTLYVTTARKNLSEEELTRQPLAGALFSVRVDTPGLPQSEARLAY